MNALSFLRGFPLLPILESASDGILLAAPDSWRVCYANPTLASWLEFAPDEDGGRALEGVLREAKSLNLMNQVEAFWHGEREQTAQPATLMINGRPQPVVLHFSRVVLQQQSLLGILIRLQRDARDHAAQVEPERRDPLTDLPDRAFLLSRMAALMRGERLADRRFAVLFVDLDNFKRVNDAEGHLIGDRVLREVARRLVHCVREGDHVARFGGDEFVVLVEQVATAAEVQPIIHRIHSVLSKPIALPDGEVTLSASIGAADASPEHRSPDDLLAAADRAMYASKRSNA